MTNQTTELIKKVEWIFLLLDATYLLRNEPFEDHVKRAVMRNVVIQVDSLLKIVGQLKNNLYREGSASADLKQRLETSISRLSSSYDNAFDTIRDKISAHTQPLDLIALLDWWGIYDYSIIEVFYQDCKHIQSELEEIDDVHFKSIPDYSQILSGQKVPESEPKISYDRFALTRQNTGTIIPNNPSQEKVQAVISVVKFLEADFYLTAISDNGETIFKNLVFDVGWLLVIIDLCSLIDNLFETSQYDGSLLDLWNADFNGFPILQQLNNSRNLVLESEVRNVRNRFAAHLDRGDLLENLTREFHALDLKEIHEYTHRLVHDFENACRADIKTKPFVIYDLSVNNAKEILNPGKPFED